MTIQRMDHVGVVVDDLAAATECFVELGLELRGEMALEDPVVGRIVGLDGVRTEFAMMQTPDGHGRWSATGTATDSATSAAPRGSSSSWPRRSADGSAGARYCR
jgi:catechol 2,3-dioxygenase-like lactoylglutathione lyase family enzyme